MELIEKLGIDWKLLIAQVINFAILGVILFKFAYKPVLAALDKRSKLIEKGVADAKASEEKLASIEELREKKMREGQKEVVALIEKAKKDADVMKEEILAAARTQSEELVNRAKEQINEERDATMSSMRQELVALVVAATGKILEREFSKEDQHRLLDAIAREMEAV